LRNKLLNAHFFLNRPKTRAFNWPEVRLCDFTFPLIVKLTLRLIFQPKTQKHRVSAVQSIDFTFPPIVQSMVFGGPGGPDFDLLRDLI
jgi:hypothetical protein